MIVSVIGLGKVGLAFAEVLVDAGIEVIGVDCDEETISGISHFPVTLDLQSAVTRSDLSVLILPTPSMPGGRFSLEYLLPVCAKIGKFLRDKKTRHTISILSTIMPGDSESQLIPCLEKSSGLKVSEDFGFCYNPAFIALGAVKAGFTSPSCVMIGAKDEPSFSVLERMHKKIIPTNTSILKMSIAETGIAKIASNSLSTMQVSFANMLCALASQFESVDVDVITQALTENKVAAIYRGATPYGGPCWPRDNLAFSALLKEHALSDCLPRSVDSFNRWYAEYLLGLVLSRTKPGDLITLVGLAYKHGVGFTDGSFGCWMAAQLLRAGRQVYAWDPLVAANAQAKLPQGVTLFQNLDECLSVSQWAIVTNHFEQLDEYPWCQHGALTILDCWRKLPKALQQELGEKYIGFGGELNANRHSTVTV